MQRGKKESSCGKVLEFTPIKFSLGDKYFFSYTLNLLIQPNFTSHLQSAGLFVMPMMQKLSRLYSYPYVS